MRTAAHLAAACSAGLLLLAAVPAHAAMQRIALQPGWNLVSFAVVPDDPAVTAVLAPLIAADNFEALWAYDAQSGSWSRFPAAVAGGAAVTVIEDGRGYWLKVLRAATLDVEGDASMASGPDNLAPGWNLVGFALDEDRPYERVIRSASVRQIWTFDAVEGEFIGVVITAQGLVAREDFINLQAGRGYWLFANEQLSLAPVLGTGLPADLDVPPLLPTESTDVAVPFSQITPGDIDINGDGFYDRTATQRGLDFGERLNIQPISIFNQGSGVLSWRIAIVDAEEKPWLRFRIVEPDTNAQTLVTELTGTLASETDVVDLVIDRTGLPPGPLEAEVLLITNAAGLPPPGEARRTIAVHATVADLDGDYQLDAEIDTVNGKPADLPDPRLTLSLYKDSDGLKAVVNEAATLLFSQRLRMSGAFIETGTSRFQVSGSYVMDADDDGNPYGVAVRRDLTLRGRRRDVNNPADAILGPLDLRGEYFETIRNVTAEPIFLAGTFVATRLGGVASARDEIDNPNIISEDIPADQPLEQTIEITRQVLITELDVTVDVDHARPADLVVTLIGPDETEVVLRQNSGAPVGRVMYDDEATPVDSLEVFNGKLSAGSYMLRLEDTQPGVIGTLNRWSLRIRGTEVHDVGGSIDGVPEGTIVLLTGCGVSSLATTAADGSFNFENLVDCVYRLRVLQSGSQTASTDVVVNGGDIGDVSIAPGAADPFMPSPVELPSDGDVTFVSLTTAAGAGATLPVSSVGTGLPVFPALESVLDATTFDVNRPPLENYPGPEDTDAFLAGLDTLKGSNRTGAPNRTADPPVGPNSRHVFIAIGGPVIGTSVQGDLRLSVGANP
jgi:subtilisin-like proprotein convertase family protein